MLMPAHALPSPCKAMKILIRSSQSKPASLPDTFNNPEDLLEILADASSRPDNAAELIRKTWDAPRLEVRPYKLDEAANWKAWVAMLGIRVKGLRCLQADNNFYFPQVG